MEATAMVIRLPPPVKQLLPTLAGIQTTAKGLHHCQSGAEEDKCLICRCPCCKSAIKFKLGEYPHPFLTHWWLYNHFISEWFKFTKDPFVIERIHSCHLNMTADFGSVHSKLELSMSEIEMLAGDAEVVKLLSKNAIVKTNFSEPQCISNVFLRAKKDSDFCIILNLKNFNNFVIK